MKKICILISGGLDSCVLACDLARQGYKVFPLFLKSGLLWEKAELLWLKKFLKSAKAKLEPLTILDSPAGDLYKNHWSMTGRGTPGYHDPDEDCYLPGRNVLLISKAAAFCAMNGIKEIALANLNVNPFPDGSPAFYRKMEAAISEGMGMKIQIIVPYRQLSKHDVVRKGKNLPLQLTFSCNTPKGNLHCGKCAKCGERHDAFLRAGVADRTRYATKPEGYRIVV